MFKWLDFERERGWSGLYKMGTGWCDLREPELCLVQVLLKVYQYFVSLHLSHIPLIGENGC